MNADLLLEHFDRIAEAPGAIPKLRKLILDLAVHGKLVEQDESDAANIPRSVQQLASLGARSAGWTWGSDGDAREDVAAVPPGWYVIPLSRALHRLQTGPFGSSLHQHDYQVGGVPVVNPASIVGDTIVPIDKMAVGTDTLDRLAAFKVRTGDVVLARRGEMGRCAVVTERENGWLCGTGCLILGPQEFVDSYFLALLIRSPGVREYLGGSAVGTTMQNLNQRILLELAVGVPPLVEQKRIVARVAELDDLLDELETAQASREWRRDLLVAASSKRLTTATDETEFRKYAEFHLNLLQKMTVRPEQIKALRQTILDLAVRGKLVEQDESEGTGHDLLDIITLAKKGNPSRRPSPQPVELVRTTEELIGPLPTGWTVAHWEMVALAIADIDHKMPEAVRDGVPYVSPRDFTPDNGIDFLNAKRVSKADFDRLSAKIRPEPGDIIYPRYGTIGENRLVQDDREFLASYSCAVIKVMRGLMDPEYQFIYSVSSLCRTQAARAENKATQPNVGLQSIKEFLIPVPPFAEQRRIAARVRELTMLCRRIADSITLERREVTRLLDATTITGTCL